MEEFTEELKREYFNALYNLQDGNNEPMAIFKNSHRELFDRVNKNYHKRKAIRENVFAMRMVSSELYCGSLTFDQVHDPQSEETKRKQARRHLDKYMQCYLYVEEYGEDNGRYHIHFIGVLDYGITYKEFYNNWHSRVEMSRVKKIKSAVNYLTDYVSKQAPRIRRNKKMMYIFNRYKKSKMWSQYGFEGLAKEEEESAIINLVFGL